MQEATEGAKAKAQRLAYAAGVLSGRRWVLEKASYSQLLKSEAILPGELWALMIRTYREVILNPGLVSMSTTGCSVSEKAFASAGQN
jgi:hypothetical protein